MLDPRDDMVAAIRQLEARLGVRPRATGSAGSWPGSSFWATSGWPDWAWSCPIGTAWS
jgi:hypothetical protein